MRIRVNVSRHQRVHGHAERGGIQNGDNKHAPRPKSLEGGEPCSVFEKKSRGGQVCIVKRALELWKDAQTVKIKELRPIISLQVGAAPFGACLLKKINATGNSGGQ